MGFQIQNYRNTAVVFAPFGCGLRVIMGVREKLIPDNGDNLTSGKMMAGRKKTSTFSVHADDTLFLH